MSDLFYKMKLERLISKAYTLYSHNSQLESQDTSKDVVSEVTSTAGIDRKLLLDLIKIFEENDFSAHPFKHYYLDYLAQIISRMSERLDMFESIQYRIAIDQDN